MKKYTEELSENIASTDNEYVKAEKIFEKGIAKKDYTYGSIMFNLEPSFGTSTEFWGSIDPKENLVVVSKGTTVHSFCTISGDLKTLEVKSSTGLTLIEFFKIIPWQGGNRMKTISIYTNNTYTCINEKRVPTLLTVEIEPQGTNFVLTVSGKDNPFPFKKALIQRSAVNIDKWLLKLGWTKIKRDYISQGKEYGEP